MTILEWIEKNAAEGADLQEAKKLVEGLKKMPESREEAAKLVEENQHIKAELDSRISKSVDNSLKKYEESKLPEKEKEIRERVQKELNPEETPEQKELRELKEWKQQQEQREKRLAKENELMEKAKELGFDPLKAKRYAAFGDDADKILEQDVKDFQDQINSKVDEQIKQRYGGKPPEAPPEKDEKAISRKEFEAKPPKEQMEFVKSGGEVADE